MTAQYMFIREIILEQLIIIQNLQQLVLQEITMEYILLEQLITMLIWI